MTDPAYPFPQASPGGRDVTAVMGRRTAAWIIDLVLYLAVAFVSFGLLSEYSDVPGGMTDLDYCDALEASFPDEVSICFPAEDRVFITSESDTGVQVLISLGYFVGFVVLQGVAGGSPGKLVTGLRVVRADGRRAGVGRSLGRTLLWIVDGAPWFAPLVGFITGLTTTGHRRVGDMAVGTYVVCRRDVGSPVTTGAPVSPPAQGAWGAPPPTWPPSPAPGGPPPPGQAGPPVGPPTAPPAPTGSSADPGAGVPVPSVDELTPDISGVPDDKPAPPPLVDQGPPESPADEPWAPPTDPGSAPPVLPEIDGPVDEPAPDVGADPTWWSGPEAAPETDDVVAPPSTDVEPPFTPTTDETEAPSWADPTRPVEDSTWAPPTAPADDFGDADDTSPTAGPRPFAAPGADPVADAPTAPEPAPMPPPQWDQARNTYIQWHPAEQRWLQWDTLANRWKPIDT